MGELADKIEGIGPGYERRLNEVEIKTLENLRNMSIEMTHEITGISTTLLEKWQSMAILQQVENIGPQFSEALVRMGITDLRKLMDTNPEEISVKIEEFYQKHIVPSVVSPDEIRGWQRRAYELEPMRLPKTPDEVGIIWETMTCRGIRNYYERKVEAADADALELSTGHPCRWFSQYGPFHAYDITVEDQYPWEPVTEINAFYVGRRYQIPELLSGCRKAPIMSVGLNPNLRAATQPWRIYPYFDDIQQYAKHFRYRTTFKYSIEREHYDTHIVDGVARFEGGKEIPLKKEHVSMYIEYDKILKALQERMGVKDSKLCLGEDVSYYNFVTCHSPRWDMDKETEEEIIGECYHKRQFFLKQLAQSMPKVILIFGKPVMRSFVANFYNAFEEGNIPDPDETYSEILSKNNFVMKIGKEKARVIFSPHPTGARPWYVRLDALTKIVDALYEEYTAENLIYDEEIKHFKRTKGACKFCNNDIYFIGKCKYKGHFEKEDTRSVEEISSDRKVIVEKLVRIEE